jgi:hypothetical protein
MLLVFQRLRGLAYIRIVEFERFSFYGNNRTQFYTFETTTTTNTLYDLIDGVMTIVFTGFLVDDIA